MHFILCYCVLQAQRKDLSHSLHLYEVGQGRDENLGSSSSRDCRRDKRMPNFALGLVVSVVKLGLGCRVLDVTRYSGLGRDDLWLLGTLLATPSYSANSTITRGYSVKKLEITRSNEYFYLKYLNFQTITLVFLNIYIGCYEQSSLYLIICDL